MTLWPYSTRVVHDRDGNKAFNSTGTLYAIDDATLSAPVTARDALGAAITVTSDESGVLNDFFLEDHTSALWKTPGFDKPFVVVTSAPVPGAPGEPGRDGSNVLPTSEAVYQELESGNSAALLSATYAKVFGVDSALGNDSTEASAGIQSALDAANAQGGGTVYVPDGIYRVGTALQIGSNTHLELSKRATIKRNSLTDSLVRNKSDNATGGYGQASNIRVSGGTFDGNAGTWATNCTMVGFGHADGVVIEGVTFRNLYGSWHEVELNGVRGGRVLNCRFLDRVGGGTTGAEMVQLDLMYGTGGFPWFGPFDNTPCVDILIQGNEFRNGVNGFGNHAGISGAPHHRDIRVVGNQFENMTDSALRFLVMENIIIEGNTARECTRFLWATQGYAPLSGIIVRGNTATNVNKQDTVEGRGIQIVGGSGVGDRKISGVVIESNVLSGMGRFGITVNYTDSAIIGGNRIKDTGLSIVGGISSTTGIWVYRAHNTRVLGNSITNTAPSSTHGDTSDVIIGAGGGAATDTSNTVFANNQISKLRVASANIVISHDNNIGTSRTLSGALQTDLREHHNMIAGVWTP